MQERNRRRTGHLNLPKDAAFAKPSPDRVLPRRIAGRRTAKSILRGDPIPQGDHKDVVSCTAASDAETALNSSFALRGIRPVTLSHCSASFCTTVRLGILV